MSLHFIRPEWLLALIPLIAIALFLWRSQQRNSAWQSYIAPHLANTLISETNQVKKQPKWLLMICWFIAVIAISGPAVNKQSLPVYSNEQGRVLVMDMSLSMYATDQKPNRLSQAKFRATDFLTNLTEGETGLIAFAGDAFTISPLTRDKSTLLNLLPTLTPDIMPVRGSDLSAALELAQQLLSQGGHITGDIIVMTDGVNPQQYVDAAKVLDGSRYRVSVMAFGTQQGAAIQLPDGQLMRDNRGEIVIDKTDFKRLENLVIPTGGLMIPATADGSSLSRLERWLANDGDAKATELEGESWQDLGPYIAMLLIIPVLLSFRFTLVPVFTALTLGLLFQPSPVMANTWDDLWQTQDQQASDTFNQAQSAEDYASAAEQFSQPLWQASAQYKAGDYENALAGFEQDNSAQGLYNQANSLMQLNKLDDAIARYQDALKQQADFPQAQKNLELAENMKQQQEQQSGEGSDQSDQSDSDNSESEQNENNPSENGEGQSQQQNSDQNSEQNAEQNQSEQQDSEQQNSQENSAEQDKQQNEQERNEERNEESSEESSEENQSQSDTSQSDNAESENEQTENEAQMQADAQQNNQAEPTPEELEQQAQAKAAAEQAEAEKSDKQPESSQPIASSQLTEEPLPADLERALRAVSEDPQVLIRNKMQLEYQKRRQSGQLPKDKQQW
ncbi:VWA domain-containing protein [Shewanella sp. 1_MG-2023]|uniref:vWA domain-containing protein n=1 Tax=unclassified Shewanella TaxID=196818 RepID=UPI0026E23D12|nr:MULTISPECIES: VWA domain-containing protein [unclassified Shewanella]MDO6613709.1 VWA domain-containing protein [Shewanella sp. 7_MG-2023]MDO6773435.1 VWA domain-containing protein [Shewanella sp. 2_MG-2023]MDO6796295.1 VWA domain-containing protein [Shewanella sp. 1_MG-2023]